MFPTLSSLVSLYMVTLTLASPTSILHTSSASSTSLNSAASTSASVSPPQIQSPIKVVNTGYHDPGQDPHLYPEYLHAKLYDPATKTSTGCLVYRSYVNGNAYPGNWTACDDATYSFKVDSFTYYGPAWGLEVRHQYQGKGKKCTAWDRKGCTTTRAYVYVDKNTTPGYNAGSGGYSTSESFKGPVYANVFSKCGDGCGVFSD